MFKKALATAAVAGAIVLAGSGAATAAQTGYAVTPPTCSVSPATLPVGSVAVVTCEFDPSLEGETVTFSTRGPGVTANTLARIAISGATGTSSVDKVVTGGTASVNFRAPAPGPYEIDLTYGTLAADVIPVAVTVTSASGSSDPLAGTGGEVPTAALWIGGGAVALGGIAVAAAAARRRRTSHR